MTTTYRLTSDWVGRHGQGLPTVETKPEDAENAKFRFDLRSLGLGSQQTLKILPLLAGVKWAEFTDP